MTMRYRRLLIGYASRLQVTPVYGRWVNRSLYDMFMKSKRNFFVNSLIIILQF